MSSVRTIVLVLASLATAPAIASAGFIVTPPGFTSTPGNAQTPAPFRFYGTGGSRNQLVYDSTDFASVTGPLAINAIQFRPGGLLLPPFFGNTLTISDVLITLSTTSRSGEGPNVLSTTFAQNVGSNVETVYSGALTLTTQAIGPPNGPDNFDYSINLQNSFIYNPLAGNLLLDVLIPTTATVSGNGTFGFDTFDAVNNVGDGIFGLTSNSDGGATTGVLTPSGPITQFSFSPLSSVPEPSSAAMVTIAVAMLRITVAYRRRSVSET
jgi:hypothetical protein